MGVFLINLSTQFKRRKKKCFNSYKTVTTSREISPSWSTLPPLMQRKALPHTLFIVPLENTPKGSLTCILCIKLQLRLWVTVARFCCQLATPKQWNTWLQVREQWNKNPWQEKGNAFSLEISASLESDWVTYIRG